MFNVCPQIVPPGFARQGRPQEKALPTAKKLVIAHKGGMCGFGNPHEQKNGGLDTAGLDCQIQAPYWRSARKHLPKLTS